MEGGMLYFIACLDTLLAMFGPTRQALGTAAGKTMKDRQVPTKIVMRTYRPDPDYRE
jgi:hypothetical protein